MNAEDRDYLAVIESRGDPDADKRWLIAKLKIEAQETERLGRTAVAIFDEGTRQKERAIAAERRAQEAEVRIHRLEGGIEMALSELGVPQPGYPAPIGEAIEQLRAALSPQAEPQEAKQ